MCDGDGDGGGGRGGDEYTKAKTLITAASLMNAAALCWKVEVLLLCSPPSLLSKLAVLPPPLVRAKSTTARAAANQAKFFSLKLAATKPIKAATVETEGKLKSLVSVGWLNGIKAATSFEFLN